jgi:hypothetical protein
MHLEQGESEPALFFRDGRMFRGRWSTRGGEYEQRTGFRRPIAFLDEAGESFPLRPGRTWIIIATPFSRLNGVAPGTLRLHVIAPEGAGVY